MKDKKQLFNEELRKNQINKIMPRIKECKEMISTIFDILTELDYRAQEIMDSSVSKSMNDYRCIVEFNLGCMRAVLEDKEKNLIYELHIMNEE